jgi:hypothetical protein
VHKIRPFLRVLGYLVLAGCCLLVIVTLTIQIRRRLLRIRAERLLDEFRSLAVDRASFADAQRVFSSSQRIQLVARDVANAAAVQVISDKTGPGSAPDSRLMVVRLMEPMKRASFWKPDQMREILVNEEFSKRDHWSPYATGSRLIILFDRFNSRGQFPGLITEPCGALRFTDNNLSAVQKGIRQDFRSFAPDQPEPRAPRPNPQTPTIN